MRRALISGGLLVVLLVASPAAASGGVSFRDIAGDANAFSGQEDGGGDGISTGPASIPSVDLRRIHVAPRYRTNDAGRRRLRALTVALTMSAPPSAGYAYHLSAAGGSCSGLIVDHYRFRDGTTRTQLRDACDGGSLRATSLPSAVVEGRTIRVKVPASALPDSVRRGGVLSRLYAYTRGNIGDAPVFPFPVTPVQFDSKRSPSDLVFGR